MFGERRPPRQRFWRHEDGPEHGPEHHQHAHGRFHHWYRGPFRQHGPFWFGRGKDWSRGGPFRGRGPFSDDPFDEDGGGRQRQRRGDIKYALLALLAEQPRHGYELIKELEQRYAGFYRPSPGSVYPTLQLLEDEGSVTGEPINGKRVYTITDAGRRLLEEWQQQNNHPDPRRGGARPGPGPELEGLRQSMMALMTTVMQAARHGSPEQRRAVLERLDATRRDVYRILAQDDTDQVI